MLAFSVVLGLLVAVFALPFLAGPSLFAKSTADGFNDLPTQLLSPPIPERSILLDATGNPITSFHGVQDRTSVPLARIPLVMRQAIIAIEDRRFYEHHGVDYKGILRAAVTNQENGAVTQGGSTITQQYVKNVLVTLADTPESRTEATDRSLRRKLREAKYAIALEKKLPKDQILTNYLNIAYFGDGAYGVATASQHYFGKDISQVNAAEAALLAGLVQNPNAYDPKRHPAAARQRRDLVLKSMGELHDLTPAQVATAKSVPILVRHDPTDSSDGCEEAGGAAFFCQYVRETLLNDPSFGPDAATRQRRLFEGGLVIKTSLDPTVQAAAQDSANRIIPPGSRVATAVVVLKPGTGEVQAMAVNRTYANTDDGKPTDTTTDRVHTKLNYALRAFQPGSTFKVFTLATALEQGLPLSTTINAPNCYESFVFSNPPGPCATRDGVGFKNAADGEGGVFSMSQATWHSVNTYFVQLEERVGVLRVRDMAKRLGVTSPRLDTVGAGDGSLTLGAFEVTPMDLATAYATLAAHGMRCWPKPILELRESSGQHLNYTGPGGCQQVLDAHVADTVSSVLQGVIREGTAAGNGAIGRPAAGKTGTTDENRSAWFAGYIPQLAGVVWVGDYRSPDRYPLRYSATTPEGVPVPGWGGGSVFGGGLPTEVWAAMMRQASLNMPIEPFPPADNTLAQGSVLPGNGSGAPPPQAPVVPAPAPVASPSPLPSPTATVASPKPSPPSTSKPSPSNSKPPPASPPTKNRGQGGGPHH